MKTDRKKIVVIGSSNTDMTILSDKLPLPGETVLGGEFIMGPGGKGANQAVAIKRLGGNVEFVCKVGRDVFGKNTLSLYQSEGFSTEHVILSDKPSGVAMIAVDSNSENSIIVAPGANNDITPQDIESVAGLIESSDYLLMQLETPVETVMAASRIAHENHVKVILNPAPATALPDSIYSMLYLIMPNQHEASLMTGIEVTDRESAVRAAEVLHQKGVEKVIITMGAKGAVLYENDESVFIEARRVKAVDTTAAGDTFCGAVCVALSEGHTLSEAAHFGAAASSLTVQKVGAQNSIPLRSELEEILN